MKSLRLLAVTVCLLASTAARAETVFSTLSGTYASNVPVGLTGVDWTYVGQQFNTGTNTLVTDVTLNLSKVGSGNLGTFDVEIWTSGSTGPGSFVGAIATGQTQGSVSGIEQNFTYSGSVSVSAGTNYWVVMNASNMNGQLLWSYTDDPASSAGFVGVVGTGLLQTTDAPLNWSTPVGITDGRMKMSVVAVPEPSTLALAGLGVAACVVAARRGRRG